MIGDVTALHCHADSASFSATATSPHKPAKLPCPGPSTRQTRANAFRQPFALHQAPFRIFTLLRNSVRGGRTAKQTSGQKKDTIDSVGKEPSIDEYRVLNFDISVEPYSPLNLSPLSANAQNRTNAESKQRYCKAASKAKGG